ncbi:hypothetical protein EON64_15830 [archaeon]|nr:MAG: hypothetical protein EON64_15830 [archaeon]
MLTSLGHHALQPADNILSLSGRTDRAMEKRADQKTGWYNRLVPALVVQKRLIPFILAPRRRSPPMALRSSRNLLGNLSYLRPIVVHLGAIVALLNAKAVLFNRRRIDYLQ